MVSVTFPFDSDCRRTWPRGLALQPMSARACDSAVRECWLCASLGGGVWEKGNNHTLGVLGTISMDTKSS